MHMLRVGLMGDYSDTEMNLFCHMARHEALTLAQALVILDVMLAIAMQDVVFSKVIYGVMCVVTHESCCGADRYLIMILRSVHRWLA